MTEAALPRLFAALVVTAVLPACGADHVAGEMHTPAQTTDQASAWTTYHDQDARFSIRYPTAWERSEQGLTPMLVDPHEIVSVGTYHMRPGGELCEHLPANALEDLGPEDAFLTVQERTQPHLEVYSPRPAQFTLGQPNEQFEGVDCVREPDDLFQWWLSFKDGDRAFYVLVARGTSASEQARQQVLETLNSFQVDASTD